MAADAHFTLYRGSAPEIRIGPITHRSTGAVLDVTGWTGSMTIRETRASLDPPTLQKATSVVSPGSSGYLSVSLTSAETEALSPGEYDFSVLRTNGGDEDVLTIGTVNIALDVYHEA